MPSHTTHKQTVSKKCSVFSRGSVSSLTELGAHEWGSGGVSGGRQQIRTSPVLPEGSRFSFSPGRLKRAQLSAENEPSRQAASRVA